MKYAFEKDDEHGSFDVICERVHLGIHIIIKELDLDKNFLFVGGSIGNSVLYVKEILTTK